MATSQSKAVMISDEVMAKVRKSMPWLPATGLDRIRACVFEVVPLGTKPCAEWAEPDGIMLVVHTKKVA